MRQGCFEKMSYVCLEFLRLCRFCPDRFVLWSSCFLWISYKYMRKVDSKHPATPLSAAWNHLKQHKACAWDPMRSSPWKFPRLSSLAKSRKRLKTFKTADEADSGFTLHDSCSFHMTFVALDLPHDSRKRYTDGHKFHSELVNGKTSCISETANKTLKDRKIQII